MRVMVTVKAASAAEAIEVAKKLKNFVVDDQAGAIEMVAGQEYVVFGDLTAGAAAHDPFAGPEAWSDPAIAGFGPVQS